MTLARCDHCERAFRSVRWVDLRTGELTSDFDHASHLCIDCQADVRASAEGKIAAGD
jgi:hypothetical protein